MTKSKTKSAPKTTQPEELIAILKERFENNMNRHSGIKWNDVELKLKENPDKLRLLGEMETTGGEPDVVNYDKSRNEYIFFDCSPESPSGRRSLCYDEEALDSRKENKPAGSALGTAAKMDIELLDEEQYRFLQQLGEFDIKTSSWLKTPPEVRKLGGAIFGDRRYNRVFVYHNGVQSYYAARGFRGSLNV